MAYLEWLTVIDANLASNIAKTEGYEAAVIIYYEDHCLYLSANIF
jgi:hypothetical protein